LGRSTTGPETFNPPPNGGAPVEAPVAPPGSALERRFRLLVEHSSDLLLIVDADARVTYCSPSVERLVGYSQDEVTGMVAYELIPDEDLAPLAALRSRASDGHSSTGTTRIRAKDGSLRWIEWTASRHLDDEAVRGIVISARDVTDRVLSERRSSASEQRYRMVTEASPDMIYVVGADGRVQFVNDRGARSFGVPAEQLVGTPLTTMFKGPTATRITAAVEHVLATGEPHENETKIVYPDGPRWVNTRLVALRDDDQITAVLGISHDVTARKTATEALEESERRYRLLFEDSPVALWEEDHSAAKVYLEQLMASGVDDVASYLREHPDECSHCASLVRTLDVNHAAVSLCGASSREELLERKRHLLPTGSAGALPSFWAAALAGQTTSRHEGINLTLTGRTVHVAETCIVAPGHETTFDRVYIADVDVSERHRTQELLLRYRLLFAEARDIMLFERASDGRILEANAAAEAAYGRPRKELLELGIRDLRATDPGPGLDAQLKAAAAGGALFETEHRRKDGTAFPVEVSSRGVLTLGGETLLLSVVRDVTARKQTERELAQTTARLERTVQAGVAALGTTAELRDPYTAGHQRRVAEFACALAAELGWDEARISLLRTAALLHDLGKIIVPAEILSKPGKLNDTEFLLIRQHAAAGAEILADIDFGGDVAAMVRQHHERLDGSGYPDHLKDGEILPEARVLAVADVVEAMVSHRPYRPAEPLEVALAEIARGSGRLYDADVCAACLRLMAEQRFAFQEV
jgi:PAS domain S-box-containing protein/putative nucleotidyltransferase with HDIG domain